MQFGLTLCSWSLAGAATARWSLWTRVLRCGCEYACMLGQRKTKENQKEPHGLQEPHGLSEIQKNYVQDSGSTKAREKQKKENKRTKISRNADKVQWDKKKNQRTLVGACGCEGWLWLWLWLWLSFAVPVFSKDALLRGGGQLRGRRQATTFHASWTFHFGTSRSASTHRARKSPSHLLGALITLFPHYYTPLRSSI